MARETRTLRFHAHALAIFRFSVAERALRGQTTAPFCDVCRRDIVPSEGAWHCAACEFDVCRRCADKPGSDAAAAAADRAALNYALLAAAKGGDVAAVRSLLDRGADASVAAADGFQPIHFAVQQGSSELVVMLINHGVRLDTTCTVAEEMTMSGPFGMGAAGDTRVTPLHMAAAAGNVFFVHLLSRLGAPLEARSNAGRTPLLVAAIGGPGQLSLPVIKALEAAGARLDATGSDGMNAFELVAANYRSAERGARPDFDETLEYLRARGLAARFG